MTDLERRVFRFCALAGIVLTLGVLIFDWIGLLGGLEKWLYDSRVAYCQFFRKPPTDRLVHVDIDDKALDAIGQWPWPRWKMAEILNEISLAKPKAVGIDIIYSEPAQPEWIPQADGKFKSVNDDEAMAAALSRLNVILPISVQLAPPKSFSTLEAAEQTELAANLEITPQEIAARLEKLGFPADQVSAELSANFLAARRAAMFQRIKAALASEPLTAQQVQDQLLGNNVDKSLHSPMRRLLSEQYDHAIAVNAADRFSLPSSLSVPNMVVTVPNLMPIPSYSQAASGGGFVDVDNLSEPVVRSIPILISENKKIFAQWGLALGCAVIDADLSKARITSTDLIVPSANGDVIVPLRNQYSRSLKRDVPLIADVPWFGTGNWQTMYDWPNHKISKQHVSINLAWDIYLTRERIHTNNSEIDKLIFDLLDDRPVGKLELDPGVARKYRASIPPLDDPLARRQIVRQADQIVNDSPAYQAYQAIDKATLTPQERVDYDILTGDRKGILDAMSQNEALAIQLEQMRHNLADTLRDKGVLIGWTATSAVDFVTTSLHARCPGVVVHGTIANAVITGQWWRTAPLWVTGLLTLFLGLSTAIATGRFTPLVAIITAGGLVAAYILVDGVVLFDWGHWVVGAAAPLVVIVMSWAGCTVTKLVLEGIDRFHTARHLAVFRHEMSLAKNVQVALIPKEMPVVAGIEPFGWTKPADETGGDLFDLWTLPDGRLGILVADASGHGLAPSVIVSQVRTLVRALSEIEKHPNGLLARVNARLAQDLEPARFVTAFLGFLDSTGTLEWASAGHGPMLWCEKAGDEFQSLDATALPLGIMEDYMGDEIGPLLLGMGGMLIVTSDGIFEAPNKTDEQYGIERVIEILKNYSDKSAIEISGAIRESVTAWQRDPDKPVDDQTTVIIRRVDAGLNVTVVEEKATAT